MFVFIDNEFDKRSGWILKYSKINLHIPFETILPDMYEFIQVDKNIK